MKRFILVSVLVLSSFVCAHGELPNGAAQWEYAQWVQLDKNIANWSQEGNELVDSAYAVYRQLGGTTPERSFGRIALMNLVGRDGWELVAVDVVGGSRVLIFKRQR